ncbi:hypothetical protein DFS33DRAFT_490120 [Desarmillaria ectypa]|nr:hypothetical protein DFS33DRAFT_490120 [Desarmillaria ectypa]
MTSTSRALNTQIPLSELEAISWRRDVSTMGFTVPPAPSEEGRIIPLSPPPRVRKTRQASTSRVVAPTTDIQHQEQNITIRPGGAWPSKATLHGLLEEKTSHLARGVDLLPEVREEEYGSPLTLLTETLKLDTEMGRKRNHTTLGNGIGGGPSRGKGNGSGGDSKVLMVKENSQQRRQHQSRSSQASAESDVFNPSKFFDSVFRFQVDGARHKDEQYAGSQGGKSRSFSELTVTLRGRGRGRSIGGKTKSQDQEIGAY